MKVTYIEYELLQAKPAYNALTLSPTSVVKGGYKAALVAFGGIKSLYDIIKRRQKGEEVYDIACDIAASKVAGKVTSKVASPVSSRYKNLHTHIAHAVGKRDVRRKNGMGGRGWLTKPATYDLVIIFHDANKAGPHIDIHIGRLSLIRRVKPHIYEQLKFNSSGMLTNDSKKILIDFLNDEIDNKSRIPQNLDHSKSNAIASWTQGSRDDTHYGAATTRQIVLKDSVRVFKAHPDSGAPIELYAPAIDPYRPMYIYRLYDSNNGSAPICIWGKTKPTDKTFYDRLHLKMVDPSVVDHDRLGIDPLTSTIKYDGSSCYFVISNKSTKVYSPRFSKRTGSRIEYTHKIGEISHITSEPIYDIDGNVLSGTIVGMGELMMYRKDSFGKLTPIPQSQAGGYLNANSVIDDDIITKIHVYRIDKIGNRKLIDLDFHSNRHLQQQVAKLGQYFDVVQKADHHTAISLGHEGSVVVPHGRSVNDAIKIKAWQDEAHDWEITSIDFKTGEKGGVAGVVHFKSLESSRPYKLGASSIGGHDLAKDMMMHPDDYIGRVAKIKSRKGHEGRAAVMQGFHDAKGVF